MDSSGFECKFNFNGFGAMPTFSADAVTGALNARTLYGMGNYVTEKLVPHQQSNAVYRIARLLLIDNTMAEWASKIQAGQCGFGSRLSEMGIEVTGSDWKPPFMSGGSAIQFEDAALADRTDAEKARFAVSGLEAQGALADRVMTDAFKRGKLKVSDAWLYLVNQHAGSLQWTESKSLKMYHESLPHGKLSADRLKQMQLAQFAGFGSYSAAMAVWNYVANGEIESPLQTVQLGSFEVLPDAQLVLSPFGPQLGLSALIRTEEGMVVKASARGSFTDFAASVESDELYTFREKLVFGAGLEGWKQQGVLGGLVKGSAGWRVDDYTTLSFNVSAKTAGFSPNQPMGDNLSFGFKLSSFF